MFILNGIFFVLNIFFALIVIFLAIQIIAAVIASKKNEHLTGTRKSVAIIIPAHNEENVIAETIQSVIPQLLKNDRIIVVADNCDDNTETIALEKGAEVTRRNNKSELGKGYALDHGLNYLKSSPPKIIIIIDADCIVGENAIEQMAICAGIKNTPVQILNLMHNPSEATIKQKIKEFAFLLKNYIRPLGMKVMGLPCPLMGTGMAFPWDVLNKTNLSNDNIVEDMALGIDLTNKGFPPYFFPFVRVTSFFPVSDTISKGQKQRWEHGHLQTIINLAPQLMWHAIVKRNMKQILFAIDIMILPLALLSALLFMLVLAVFSLTFLNENSIFLFKFTSSILIIFTVSILLAWAKFGRSIITARELLTVPFYILGKITIYFNFFTNKQKKWVKTKRNNDKVDDV